MGISATPVEAVIILVIYTSSVFIFGYRAGVKSLLSPRQHGRNGA